MINQIYMLDNDYLFKSVFKNPIYLKKLLCDFFNIKCTTIEYLNTELIKYNKNDKVGLVDLLLNIDGEIVILELQNIDRHNFKERLLFYSSNIIANYCLRKNEDYNKLRSIKVYAIVNYPLFNNDIKNKVRLKTKREIFTSKLEYQIFDLTKVDKNNKRIKYYELVNLFKTKDLDKLTMIINNKLNIEILEIIKGYNLNGEERLKMNDIAQMMMNETEHYDTAYEAGIEVGTERGISLGINQGINRGINQGKNQEKINIAKNLINKKVDIDFIMDVTGLTYDQIISL
ncbi:MAG: Rpn family recombination-promoting nuclease/putative transposase [Bacilli bacterium]|nr:Rpn family recombination-promoting nuclease/putative transposase [Bacilli bacterium]